MKIPPKDRLEIVLMADVGVPIKLWVESTGALAKRIEYGKEKSIRILGGAAILFIFVFYLFPAAVVILLLLGLLVLFPLKLVGMAGYSRGT
jgi:hypothetical protein